MRDETSTPGGSANIEGAVARAGSVTLGDLLALQAERTPDRVAVVDYERSVTYGAFDRRVNRLAHALGAMGLGRGNRVGILSENRLEYIEALFAAAKLGAILATFNWRLSDGELETSIRVATPKLLLVSERYRETLARLAHGAEAVVYFGDDYEARLAAASDSGPEAEVGAEDGVVIIYTSGTTAAPKGAVISHRAEIARLQIARISYGLRAEHTALAWTPMFHIASIDPIFGVLSLGGKVVVADGFDLEVMIGAIAEEPIWWLVLIPGMVDRLVEALEARPVTPRGVTLAGAQADLLPRHLIARVSALLRAPFWNTFGSTECGLPLASANWFPIGEVPERMSKTQDIMNRIRLIDADDREVASGTPGEVAFRGPSLFSGYWNAEAVNARDFRGGWFHTGDVLRRNVDGTLDFVDRVKYMIKSGGENVYPAEIEAVLLADARIDEAVVIRRADARWGEVATAFVAANDKALTAAALHELCAGRLAGYKRPKEFRFVALDAFPRGTTGKIQRHEVEKWLDPAHRPAGSDIAGERHERE